MYRCLSLLLLPLSLLADPVVAVKYGWVVSCDSYNGKRIFDAIYLL